MDEMERACSMHGREVKYIKCWPEKPEGKGSLGRSR
jgi:hypothetical protein